MKMCALVLLVLVSGTAMPQQSAQCEVPWASRAKYREENARTLEKKAPRSVVLLGGTLVEQWDLGKHFADKEYLNRGIAQQGTAQMLLRFRQDVVKLRPRAVVIFAGLNDLRNGVALADIQENVMMMAQLAKANGIRVLFASAQPIDRKGSNPDASRINPERIRELNRWLFQYAKDHGDVYVDFWSPLGDDSYSFKKEYTSDGLHPNEAGYKVMTPVLEKRLSEAFVAGIGQVSIKGD